MLHRHRRATNAALQSASQGVIRRDGIRLNAVVAQTPSAKVGAVAKMHPPCLEYARELLHAIDREEDSVEKRRVGRSLARRVSECDRG